MNIISLIFEGADKDFIIHLLVQNYNFRPLDRHKTIYKQENGNTIIVFPFPELNNSGGISQFVLPITYYTCHQKALKQCFIGNINYPIQHILLRDTDRMNYNDEVSWHSNVVQYHEAFSRAHCNNGILKIMFCQRKIENWYLAGLSEKHFGVDGVLKNQKRTLLTLRNSEDVCVDDHMRQYLTNPELQRTEIAISMAKHFDIVSAKKKSQTFFKYIDTLEQLMI